MTDESRRPSRNWKRLAVLAAIVILLLVLYPQLMDFGAEIYRLFS